MKKNFLKIFIFFIIIFLTPKVFADDFNVSSSITAPTCSGSSCSGGHYTSLEIYNSGSQNVYSVGTRYNGQISTMKFNVPLPSSWPDGSCYSTGDISYTLTLNMATEDWRNHFSRPFISSSSSGTNWATSNVVFVNKKKVYFNFKIPSSNTCYDFLYVSLTSPNQSSTAFTGVSNWDLSSVILSVSFPSSSGSGSGSGGSTGASNQDIINSANDNTNTIVQNENNNTNNIIDNNNQNTTTIIENNNANADNTDNTIKDNIDNSLMNCSPRFNITWKKGKSFSHTGALNLDEDSYYTEDYIPTGYATKITMSNAFLLGPGATFGNIIIYDANKNYLDYWGVYNRSFDLPSGAKYFRISSIKKDIYVYSGNGCTSKLDETNEYLKDDSNPNIADNEFTSLFDTVGFNDPLGYLLQLPVQFINQLVSQSNTCQTISLGTLWGVSLSLPCIDIGSIIGQQVWDIIDVLFSVGLLVVIFKNLYQTFANLMTMGGEKEAREKFSMPTPMEFLSIILGGDR